MAGTRDIANRGDRLHEVDRHARSASPLWCWCRRRDPSMSKRRRRVGQLELVPRSKRATIEVEPTHRLVELTDRLDWDDLEARAELIRANKLESAGGRPPHLPALAGGRAGRAPKR